ncbi:Uncharacterized membrane protein [Solimonas aquatica]|uniref:Uncharacterized membrane protein n=1 Tax=Solimonas aquatica TaxID=489703 RepID=A0A1H8ZDH4_9GAMM|nr:TMEM175 family protein [Solimonas aquatica]SEP62490.1 Uncharacterized membrane protein [Solimonas aquatica]
MGKGRLEAFSDGVLAIIITIMVLELKPPHAPTLEALGALWPVFSSYALSFLYVGIYWNNHHHLMHAVHRVNGRLLWANLHLLFWLSLVPFTTAWMGENHFDTVPVAVYGLSLLMPALAWPWLQHEIVREHGRDSLLASALGRDFKGKISIALYLAGIALAFYNRYLACLMYLAVALIWFLPDRRIESKIQDSKQD